LRRLALLVVALLTAVLVAAGCGAQGEGLAGADLQNGKDLFVKGPGGGKPPCGSCHTLAAAATVSNVGPNLDDAFARARDEEFDESSIYQITLDQIHLASPPMPDDIVTGQDARDVAAYVATNAGVPPEEQGATSGATTTSP
jgi:mono/diheme cytochrome c family protein